MLIIEDLNHHLRINIVLQQIEGVLVVAKIMSHAIGLHPIVLILDVTIGAQQSGRFGALLTIPITTVGYIFFQEWQKRNRV
jgi:predicted PurR-regulated permease PerM